MFILNDIYTVSSIHILIYHIENSKTLNQLCYYYVVYNGEYFIYMV